MVEGTLMGGDLVIFCLMGEYHPQPTHYGKHCGPKFSKPNRMLDSFTKNISPERLYHFNSFFVWQFRIMIETYRISCGYWWLLQFFASVSLKTKLMFLHIFKYVLTSCLYQFTLYFIYYIFYIYNLHYILYYSVVF